MTKFFYQYVSWLVTAEVKPSGEEVAPLKSAVKGTGSGIGLVIFLMMNKIIDDNGKNLGNRQMHYYVIGDTANNATKYRKTKK